MQQRNHTQWVQSQGLRSCLSRLAFASLFLVLSGTASAQIDPNAPALSIAADFNGDGLTDFYLKTAQQVVPIPFDDISVPIPINRIPTFLLLGTGATTGPNALFQVTFDDDGAKLRAFLNRGGVAAQSNGLATKSLSDPAVGTTVSATAALPSIPDIDAQVENIVLFDKQGAWWQVAAEIAKRFRGRIGEREEIAGLSFNQAAFAEFIHLKAMGAAHVFGLQNGYHDKIDWNAYHKSVWGRANSKAFDVDPGLQDWATDANGNWQPVMIGALDASSGITIPCVPCRPPDPEIRCTGRVFNGFRFEIEDLLGNRILRPGESASGTVEVIMGTVSGRSNATLTAHRTGASVTASVRNQTVPRRIIHTLSVIGQSGLTKSVHSTNKLYTPEPGGNGRVIVTMTMRNTRIGFNVPTQGTAELTVSCPR